VKKEGQLRASDHLENCPTALEEVNHRGAEGGENRHESTKLITSLKFWNGGIDVNEEEGGRTLEEG